MKGILRTLIWFILGLELLLVMFVLFSKFLTPDEVETDLDEAEQQEIENIIMPTFTKESIPEDVYRKIYNVSFTENENITLEDLDYLKITYYDFEGTKHIGDMICNKQVSDDILSIFKELYDIKYPIEKIELVDNYNADDKASMKANNTSCFNYRVISGTQTLSNHALGCAVDINPLQNPSVSNGVPSIKESEKYINRKNYKMGMITDDDDCVRIFKEHGWSWGGDWIEPKDYQHFEKEIKTKK